MNVIVVGSGGREHAIAWKLAQSPKISCVVCVPGNAGTAQETKCKNFSLNKAGNSLQDYVKIAKEQNCTLAVIGPENPLSQGISDVFWQAGIPCVGPKKQAAQLEASKDFAKSFMQKYGVAKAQSKTFCNIDMALDYIRQTPAPLVLKADGLAAGKGVVVAKTTQEALDAARELMAGNMVGQAGKKIVIEEYLEGTEVSVLCAVCITKDLAKQKKAIIKPFLTARDHKRLLDGAKGPNTGGMGAICPAPDVSKEQFDLFQKDILQPTQQGIIEEGWDYRGFIFFGLMLTKQGPKLLEYNVRLGDPETQAVLPLMKSDFYELCSCIAEGTLQDFCLEWEDGFCVCPMAVSTGYPLSYQKGLPISVNEEALETTGAKIFISGATLEKRKGDTKGSLITSGGRVLCASSKDKDFEKARCNAYDALCFIDFPGMFYRKDIGLPGAASNTL